MRLLKKILFGLAIIIAIPLIAAIFIKKKYVVEKTIIINRNSKEVFDYIKLLKNQDEYSKWSQLDPKMKKSYKGVDGKVGFISHWESNHEEVGVGEQEIKKIDEGKRIDFELRFLIPFEATEPAFMTTEIISKNKTKVTWGFSGHIEYPMNIMFLFVDFEKMIGEDLTIGLFNLKNKLEN